MRRHLVRTGAALGMLVLAAGLPPAAAQPAEHAADRAWVHAKGKVHRSGVLVGYAVGPAATPGQRVTVRLRLGGATEPEGASVTVRDMTDGRTLLSLHLAARETREVELAVQARAEGVQFLDVHTLQGSRSSIVSIPLQVGHGKVALRQSGKPTLSASGEAVVVMPAQTSSPAKR